MPTFDYRSPMPVSAEALFAWHARPGALGRLIPPWQSVEVAEKTGSIRDGDRVTLKIRTGPMTVTWVAEHRGYIEGRQFRDVQVSGPFRRWEHTHRFEPRGATTSELHDHIEYELPGGAFGRWFGGGHVRGMLAQMFAYRHAVTAGDLAAQARHAEGARMKIAISGASGLVGSELQPYLTTAGHDVVRLVRHDPKQADEVRWDPKGQEVDTIALAGVDAVVHLAGENITGRWNEAKKRRIRDSRVLGTTALAKALAALDPKPRVLVAASAVGYYGDRGATVLDESAEAGEGFLAEVAKEWEAATIPAADAGIRVVNPRIGVVLSPRGGALAKVLPIFKAGGGGPVGGGDQYWSWISLPDVVDAIHHALMTDSLTGPVNATAPSPVTNAEFTKTLASVLHRPAVVPVPAFAVRMTMGEMADELLLASTRVEPAKLSSSGFEFRFPTLEPALRHLLGKA